MEDTIFNLNKDFRAVIAECEERLEENQHVLKNETNSAHSEKISAMAGSRTPSMC